MRGFHYAMWMCMAIVFVTSGALIAGQKDMIKQKQYEIILLKLPLSALCELNVKL